MYTRSFTIPSAVYFYCLLPSLLIIIGVLLIMLFSKKQKGSYYYNYKLNYLYNGGSILITILLLPLLLGYSIAMIYLIVNEYLVNIPLIVIIVLALLPVVPLVFFILVTRRFIKTLKMKKELDDNYDFTSNDKVRESEIEVWFFYLLIFYINLALYTWQVLILVLSYN